MGGALRDRTRYAVLLTVLDGIAYPAQMAEQLGLSRAGVSKHLTYLRGCGLLVRTRGDEPGTSSPTQRWSSRVTTTAWPAGAAHVPETPAAALAADWPPAFGIDVGVLFLWLVGGLLSARLALLADPATSLPAFGARSSSCSLWRGPPTRQPRNAHSGVRGSRCWSPASTPPCCWPSEPGSRSWRCDGWGSPTSWPARSWSWPCSVA